MAGFRISQTNHLRSNVIEKRVNRGATLLPSRLLCICRIETVTESVVVRASQHVWRQMRTYAVASLAAV